MPSHDTVFFIGVAVGLLIGAVVAVWAWINKTSGNDHALTLEEIKKRVGECFNCEKNP